MNQLRISLSDDDREVDYVFTQCPVIIGRHPSCGLQLRDIKASRHHATVALEGDDIVVHDMGSTKGTVVFDGPRSTELHGEAMRISGGRVSLRLGSTSIRVKIESADTHTLPAETVKAAATESAVLRVARAMAASSKHRESDAEAVLDAVFRSVRELNSSLKTPIPGAATCPREGSLTTAQTALLVWTDEVWRSLAFVALRRGLTIAPADVPPGDAFAPVRMPPARTGWIAQRAPPPSSGRCGPELRLLLSAEASDPAEPPSSGEARPSHSPP